MIFDEIPIFFATDDNYAPFLATALQSLLDNASKDAHLRVFVLTEVLSEENKTSIASLCKDYANASVTFVNVSDQVKRFNDSLHLRDYYSKATYYRIFIPALFPQYDRCIYLDCDIIVRGDITQLYHCGMTTELLAGIVDDAVTNTPVFCRYTAAVLDVPPDRYFNAGVLVLNLAKLREIEFEKQFADLLSRRSFPVAQDQDYLNTICYGNVFWVKHEWNMTAFPTLDESENPCLVHFKMNFKPWHYENIPYEKDFWHYAAKTPYYAFLTRMLREYTPEEKERDEAQAQSLLALAQQEIDKYTASRPATSH